MKKEDAKIVKDFLEYVGKNMAVKDENFDYHTDALFKCKCILDEQVVDTDLGFPIKYLQQKLNDFKYDLSRLRTFRTEQSNKVTERRINEYEKAIEILEQVNMDETGHGNTLNNQTISDQSLETIKRLLKNDLKYAGSLARLELDEQSEHELGLAIGRSKLALDEVNSYARLFF